MLLLSALSRIGNHPLRKHEMLICRGLCVSPVFLKHRVRTKIWSLVGFNSVKTELCVPVVTYCTIIIPVVTFGSCCVVEGELGEVIHTHQCSQPCTDWECYIVFLILSLLTLFICLPVIYIIPEAADSLTNLFLGKAALRSCWPLRKDYLINTVLGMFKNGGQMIHSSDQICCENRKFSHHIQALLDLLNCLYIQWIRVSQETGSNTSSKHGGKCFQLFWTYAWLQVS